MKLYFETTEDFYNTICTYKEAGINFIATHSDELKIEVCGHDFKIKYDDIEAQVLSTIQLIDWGVRFEAFTDDLCTILK